MKQAMACLAALVLATAQGCGGGGGNTPPRDAGRTVTADAAVAPDAGPAPPNLSVALDCGRGAVGTGAGPDRADSLQRAVIDTGAFPDAICNDGSPAAIYFRPFRGEANRNRWLINLRGGGACSGGQSCAARWCGCAGASVCPATPADTHTNFDRGNMVSAGAATQNGTGIFLRGDPARPNPIEDYNEVRVVYCSSDRWTGTRRAAPMTATHPVTGAPVSYSIHFLGARILEAVLSTLRHDGARGPTYTQGGANTPMPDLDEATEVILAGDSAGGGGVIFNLDRVAATLRARNAACAGGACPLVVRGLIDATVGPDSSRLTLSPTGRIAMNGATTYTAWAEATARVQQQNQGFRGDESCVAWHAANMPGTEHVCSDGDHVIRHHVTTPFFVRMALRDGLISSGYYEGGWVDPTLGPFDREATVFARVLHGELSAFPMMRATAEEGAMMTQAPGVFAPLCTNHDTINEDSEVYGVTITPNGGGAARRLFDVFEAWRAGTPNAAVLSNPAMNATVCPPAS